MMTKQGNIFVIWESWKHY